MPRPDLAYFWGEDAWSIERAARDFRADLEQQAGQPYDVWRTSGDEDDASAEVAAGKRRDRVIDGIAEHLATAPMFSAGTLVVVRQPGSLLREAAARERVMHAPDRGRSGQCARLPGPARGRWQWPGPAGRAARRDRGRRRHGQGLPGPVARTHGGLDRQRAPRSSASRMAPGAARLLAERVGAYVREGDVDRRRMSELANGELEKLALYRPNGTIAREDIDALVARGRARLDLGVPRRARQPPYVGGRDACQQAARRGHADPGHDHADPSSAARADRRRRPSRRGNQASRPGARAEAPAVPGAEADRAGANLAAGRAGHGAVGAARAGHAQQGHRAGRIAADRLGRPVAAGADRVDRDSRRRAGESAESPRRRSGDSARVRLALERVRRGPGAAPS